MRAVEHIVDRKVAPMALSLKALGASGTAAFPAAVPPLVA